MNIRNQQEAEARKVYELYWESYTKGNLTAFSSTLDDAFEMIGTSANEICHNKAEGIAFYKAQMHEVIGKAEMRNRRISVKPVNGMFLFNEICDIYILNEPAGTFYSSLRVSTFLHETASGWKMIQQHGSLPDLRVQEWETLAFEKISKENLELRDAIKRNTIALQNKNRELEIEAALERVRALTMAMHNSEDMGKCIVKMFSELTALGVDEGTRFGIGILNHDNENNQLWTARKDGEEVNMHIGNLDMTSHPLLISARKAWKEQLPLHQYVLEGEDLLDYYQMINDAPDYKLRVAIEKLPNREFHYGFVFEHGFFYAFSPNQFQPELINITQRFTALFEQTYRRYLDLVKAEAQAREAEIELTLERVRARTMAMHYTEELKDVIQVVFDQFVGLNIHVEHAGFILDYKEQDDMHIWLADHQQGVPTKITIPYFDSPHWNSFLEAKTRHKSFFANLLSFEVKNKFYRDLFGWIPELTEEAQQVIFSKPGLAISTVLLDNVGLYIEHYSETPFSAEDNGILMRFGKVFQQTHTRFLDLKKAEAQAREAKIENSLERVRSRTMAMQSSDELPEVANQLFTEVRALGIHAWSCGYNILADDKKTATCCMSSEGTMQTPFQLRLWGEASFDEMGDFIGSDKTMLVQELGGKALEAHYAYMKSFPDLKPTFDEIKRLGLSLPTYQINHLCKFTQGFILFITYEKVPDAHEIFKRFTNVFDQTYIRFLDLKKAEAQAREAIKQAALERVRGEIASMRSANDLEIITPLVWRELTNLGIPFIRCGVFIVDGKKETVEVHLSSPDGKPLAAMHLAFDANDLTLHAVEAWKKNAVHVQQWCKEDFINYGKQMVAQGQVKDLQSYQGDAAAPELLYLHFIPFSQGLLYVGSLQPLIAEEIQLVTLLAKSFAIAYARYEDFIKLEQAKAEVESAMSVLKATQSQLVQQEKLASLGQLTAGIAHEIKNPLNFVNNFTEVSIELIEEAIAEIQKHDNDKDASLIDHNLDDIKANLKKVYDHGTRANSIVNSMLMHSRGGGGSPEPTPLNDFIREYSNLAFHGMRASKSPVDVKMIFQWDENIREIPLIVEDFSRVVLNICNNAFDAMREKFTKYEVQSTKLEGGEDHRRHYVPTLSIQTRLENGKVCIQFEDNGLGIPDKIKDKILQPFFTTKKGTEGTGLGLSISNDIVKAHGGELKVEAKEGQGSVFSIGLPVGW